jgi:flagellar biogenesis protein FliO
MELAVLLRFVAALAVIALVLVGLRFGVRLWGRPFSRRGRLMELVETQFLPGGTSLHVVGVAGRYFLIGRAAQIALLAEFAPGDLQRAHPPR